LRESARDAALAAYNALPQRAKRGLKKMLRITGSPE
jgi:hypothetical protein